MSKSQALESVQSPGDQLVDGLKALRQLAEAAEAAKAAQPGSSTPRPRRVNASMTLDDLCDAYLASKATLADLKAILETTTADVVAIAEHAQSLADARELIRRQLAGKKNRKHVYKARTFTLDAVGVVHVSPLAAGKLGAVGRRYGFLLGR